MRARFGRLLAGWLAGGTALLLAAIDACAAVAASAASPPPLNRMIIINDDGFSSFFTGDYRTAADVRERILKFRDLPVAVFEWSFLAGSRANYPSHVTELIGAGLTEFPRRGDQLAHDALQAIADSGVNLTAAIATACHAAGVQCYASLRMNGDYAEKAEGALMLREMNSDFWWQHPEWRIRGAHGEDRTRLSYAFPEVRAFKLALLREVAACEIDGVNLDFMRHPPFFGYEETMLRAFHEKFGEDARAIQADDPRWFAVRSVLMTEFVRTVRAMLDEAGEKRGRRIGLSVRIDWHDYRDWGCDLEGWVKAGWLDYLVAAQHTLGGYEFDLKPFVTMAAGTRCKIYFGEEALLSGHDLTAAEDKLVAEGKMARPPRGQLAPQQYRARATQWREMGAAGVQLFNLGTAAPDAIRAAGSPWQN